MNIVQEDDALLFELQALHGERNDLFRLEAGPVAGMEVGAPEREAEMDGMGFRRACRFEVREAEEWRWLPRIAKGCAHGRYSVVDFLDGLLVADAMQMRVMLGVGADGMALDDRPVAARRDAPSPPVPTMKNVAFTHSAASASSTLPV